MSTPETAAAAPAPRNPARRKALTGVTALVAVAGLAYGAYWALVLNHYESTDNAYVQGNVVQITPQVDNHVRQGNVLRADRIASATQHAGIQHLGQLCRLGAILSRLGDTFRAEARVAPRSPHRADQATQAATAAGGVFTGVGARIHQKITSRLRIMAGSAWRFISRWRSTSASPKTRRM